LGVRKGNGWCTSRQRGSARGVVRVRVSFERKSKSLNGGFLSGLRADIIEAGVLSPKKTFRAHEFNAEDRGPLEKCDTRGGKTVLKKRGQQIRVGKSTLNGTA